MARIPEAVWVIARMVHPDTEMVDTLAFKMRSTSAAHSSASQGGTKSEGSALGSAANFSAMDLNDAPFSSQSASYAPISRRGEIAAISGVLSFNAIRRKLHPGTSVLTIAYTIRRRQSLLWVA